MKHADKERENLREVINNSETPREDIHELYKQRMANIFFELILEFIDYTRSDKAPKKMTNIHVEKWIKKFVEERFIPE